MAISGALVLFGKLKFGALERSHLAGEEALRREVQGVAQELTVVRREVDALLQKSEPAAMPAFGPAIRIQALRLIQNGKVAADIATELRVPRNQIELLIKVQRLVAGQIPG